ncbi:hypothetical protein [Desulfonatronospira thiodismutans]|nr:hypothetical protein [Desulfonatronospira thiodismutans]
MLTNVGTGNFIKTDWSMIIKSGKQEQAHVQNIPAAKKDSGWT